MLRKVALLLVFVGVGCGDAHLGDLYGRRTRGAFDAQAQARGGDSAGTLDADDAKIALARHRGKAPPGTPGGAVPSSSFGGGSYSFGGGAAAPWSAAA